VLYYFTHFSSDDSNIQSLVENGLITSPEKIWLDAAEMQSRPFIVIAWLHEFTKSVPLSGLEIGSNIAAIRGGINATIAAVNTQLPYPYVHIFYWTVQLVLITLSVETGICIAVDSYWKENGDNLYIPSDDNVSWPASSQTWFTFNVILVIMGNLLFIIFTQCILTLTEKLSNPMNKDSSLSATALGTPYDNFLFNLLNFHLLDSFLVKNLEAIHAGFKCYEDLDINK